MFKSPTPPWLRLLSQVASNMVRVPPGTQPEQQKFGTSVQGKAWHYACHGKKHILNGPVIGGALKKGILCWLDIIDTNLKQNILPVVNLTSWVDQCINRYIDVRLTQCPINLFPHDWYHRSSSPSNISGIKPLPATKSSETCESGCGFSLQSEPYYSHYFISSVWLNMWSLNQGQIENIRNNPDNWFTRCQPETFTTKRQTIWTRDKSF